MLNLAPSGGFNVAGSRSSHRSKAITSGGKARGCFPLLLQRVMLPSERKHSKVSVSNFFAHRAFRSQSTILSQPVVFKLAGVAVRHCQLPVRVPLLHVDCPEFLVSLLVSNLKKLFAATNYMPIVFIHVA